MLGWRRHETGALQLAEATTGSMQGSSAISGADAARKTRLRMVSPSVENERF
jgi:D-alanyl-D-alanine carboxypeptidase